MKRVGSSQHWRVSWENSPNIEEIGEGKTLTFAVGNLSGRLRYSEGLTTGSPETLGKDALKTSGSFAVVRVDDESVTVVTDLGGSIPVLWGDGPKGIAVGTRSQVVAHRSGLEAMDQVSAVDYLMHRSICYPYTWFEKIRLLPPGSVSKISAEGIEVHTYWEPTEPDKIYESSDVNDWASQMRDRVGAVVQQSMKEATKARVFFSGGHDSRAVASLVPEGVECVLTTVLDRKNREYRLARRAAQALGRPLEWVPRPENYYRRNIAERIRSIGLGWDFRHAHFSGSISRSFEDADALIGGYASDSIFKTYYMSNVEERRGIRPNRLLPPRPNEIEVLKQSETESDWFKAKLVQTVIERRTEHHQRLKKMRPLTAGNWHALWPLSNLSAYAQYLSELRIGPRVIEPFLSSQVYRLAANMPDACRVEGRAFRQAFSEEMGLAGWVPVSYGGVPRLGGHVGEFVASMIGRMRLLKRTLAPSSGTQGPWTPDHYGWLPVNPEKHFGKADTKRMKERLGCLLAEGETPDVFLGSESPSSEAAVRALSLAVDS